MAIFSGKTVWVEEFSQIPAWIWGAFYIMAVKHNTKFIFTGDPDQLNPPMETTDYNGYFFRKFLERAEKLTTNHRCEPELLELANAVYEGRPIPENLFVDFFDHNIDYHLTLSHALEKVINEEVMKGRGLTFDPPSEGLRVKVIKSYKPFGLAKGQIYIVDKMEWLHVNMRRIFPPSDEAIIIPYGVYVMHCEPGYAMTIDSCIGKTIDESMAIYEVNKIMKFPGSRKRLYTAITRNKLLDNILFYKKYPVGMKVPITPVEQDDKSSNLMSPDTLPVDSLFLRPRADTYSCPCCDSLRVGFF